MLTFSTRRKAGFAVTHYATTRRGDDQNQRRRVGSAASRWPEVTYATKQPTTDELAHLPPRSARGLLSSPTRSDEIVVA